MSLAATRCVPSEGAVLNPNQGLPGRPVLSLSSHSLSFVPLLSGSLAWPRLGSMTAAVHIVLGRAYPAPAARKVLGVSEQVARSGVGSVWFLHCTQHTSSPRKP